MNADTKSNILAIALEAKQLELERARMEAEDLRSRNVETTDKLTEEVSFIHVCLQNRQHDPSLWMFGDDELVTVGEVKNLRMLGR